MHDHLDEKKKAIRLVVMQPPLVRQSDFAGDHLSFHMDQFQLVTNFFIFLILFPFVGLVTGRADRKVAYDVPCSSGID